LKMRMVRTSVLAPWVVLALLAAGPAFAADPAPTARSAVALYEEGVKLAEAKSYQAAEASFLAAWSIQKSYDVAANLGEVEMQLGKPAEAAGYFVYALAHFPLGGKPAAREWITGRLKDARNKVFVLTLDVNVPGAEVRVNGKPAGKAPLGEELFVPAGEATVEVTAPGYEAWSRKLPAAAGGSEKLAVTLVQPPRSLAPGALAGGVGAAALVAGVALYIVSTDKYEEARRLKGEIEGSTPDHCRPSGPNPKCADLKSAAETSDALFAPSIALLVGGGLLMAAGGAYLGVTLAPPSAPAAGSGPRVTALGFRGTGVFVQGSF
jgi:tetratricopeptide (TPR) repeat protein